MTKTCVGCKKRPTYGVRGSKASHCVTHKLGSMVDVVNKTCKECGKIPKFGVPGSKTPLYCATHKLENMVDVVNKTCKECGKIPKFGVPGSKTASYCATHKLEKMVNVLSKTCNDCERQPSFGVPGSKTALYCATHKLEKMVNVSKKTCNECKRIPSFGVPGSKTALYCATHKLENMVDLRNKTCIECEKQPNFGVPGSKTALYCATHKLENMVNVLSKTCVLDWCSTIIGKRYRGYCVRCFVYLFPDERVSRDYKTRERTVVDFLMGAFQSVTWIYNKRVSNGCSKYQPDLLCDLGDQVLMVEIDENQHATYDCSCENKRLMELSRDIGHRPLVVIRFNPDKYVDAHGVKHTSCFGVDNRGMVCVAKRKRDEWDDRLACLRSTISYWMTYRTDKTVEVVSLFFTQS